MSEASCVLGLSNGGSNGTSVLKTLIWALLSIFENLRSKGQMTKLGQKVSYGSITPF